MKALPLPSRAELLEVFRYDPLSGLLYWRDALWTTPQTRAKISGKQAGRSKSGHESYIQVRYKKKNYMAHRIIWKMVHGTEPLYIDHDDWDKSNNRIGNLRDCTHSQNCAAKRWNERELPRGVVRHKGKFQAQIAVDNNKIYLGFYDSAEKAGAAYVDAASKYFGEFARLTP